MINWIKRLFNNIQQYDLVNAPEGLVIGSIEKDDYVLTSKDTVLRVVEIKDQYAKLSYGKFKEGLWIVSQNNHSIWVNISELRKIKDSVNANRIWWERVKINIDKNENKKIKV